jgi:hypothetical protein
MDQLGSNGLGWRFHGADFFKAVFPQRIDSGRTTWAYCILGSAAATGLFGTAARDVVLLPTVLPRRICLPGKSG